MLSLSCCFDDSSNSEGFTVAPFLCPFRNQRSGEVRNWALETGSLGFYHSLAVFCFLMFLG